MIKFEFVLPRLEMELTNDTFSFADLPQSELADSFEGVNFNKESGKYEVVPVGMRKRKRSNRQTQRQTQRP